MKAALFSTCRYHGPAAEGGWPVPGRIYDHAMAQESLEGSLAQFRIADEVGFDWVSVAEHHFAPFSLTPNPMIMAGALTQAVRRAKIAVLGADIPILNPVRVAEEIAMLDAMTNGRVVAGMFRGTPNEYVTYNINPAESRGRFEEALALIRQAWMRTEPFGWQGRYYEYRTISLWPRCVQKPHPKIYMSGSSPESGEFAARERIGLGFAVTTVPLSRKAVSHWRAKAREAGWTPQPDDVIYRVPVHCADTDDQALADWQQATQGAGRVGLTMANRALESAIADTGYYGRDIEAQRARLMPRDLRQRVEEGALLIGSPQTVLQQLESIKRELDCGVIDFTIAHQMGARTDHAIRLLGDKVLPQIARW